uniref:Uncharacterized protein n=1 Tax=Staphylothermus marinus TaxID=2280 RepID=A0A7C4HC79_STAMA
MGFKKIELEYYDKIDETSIKLKDVTLQAYISLNSVFTGIFRYTGREIHSVYDQLIRDTNRCYFHRISLRRDSEWDEISMIICSKIVIACHGIIEDHEYIGKELLERVVNNISSEKYSHCVLETLEIPLKLIGEKLGVDTRSVLIEEKKEEKPLVEEKSVLKTTEKPVEIERIVEEISTPETVATIPIETSVARTETIPEERVNVRKEVEIPVVEKPATEESVRKPIVLEETFRLDKPILEFSDKLMNLADRESIGISNVVIYGDQDRLEVEIVVSKIGWSKKRERILKLAESIADVLLNILLKHNAFQKDLSITVRHGLNAVRISKKL